MGKDRLDVGWFSDRDTWTLLPTEMKIMRVSGMNRAHICCNCNRHESIACFQRVLLSDAGVCDRDICDY